MAASSAACTLTRRGAGVARSGSGELQVLLLAREVNADWVVIDEKLARRVARTMRIPVKGTLGVLLAAHYAGRFPAEDCRRAVSDFTAAGIRLSPSLIEWFVGQLTP